MVDTLALLRQNPKLSARDKGWLENVCPGMWRPDHRIGVRIAATRQALQTETEPTADGGAEVPPGWRYLPR